MCDVRETTKPLHFKPLVQVDNKISLHSIHSSHNDSTTKDSGDETEDDKPQRKRDAKASQKQEDFKIPTNKKHADLQSRPKRARKRLVAKKAVYGECCARRPMIENMNLLEYLKELLTGKFLTECNTCDKGSEKGRHKKHEDYSKQTLIKKVLVKIFTEELKNKNMKTRTDAVL